MGIDSSGTQTEMNIQYFGRLNSISQKMDIDSSGFKPSRYTIRNKKNNIIHIKENKMMKFAYS